MASALNRFVGVRYKKRLLAICFVFLTLAIIAEFSCRALLGLGNPILYTSHNTIEYLMRPDQDVWRFGNRTIVNQYGMRSRPIPPTKDGQLRILVFGDSVVNGGALTDHSELATTLLEHHLKGSLPGKDVFVGNVSAGSWGPGNWLQYAREFGFFDADCLVLVVSSHDYADNPTFAPLNEMTQPTQKPWSAIGEGISRYLPRLVSFVAGDTVDETSKQNTVPELSASQLGLDDLRSFLLLAKSKVKDVYVIQHPERNETVSGKFLEGHDEIAEICRQLEIPVSQLGPRFQSAIGSGIEPYRDYIHPNSNGQCIISDLLFDILSANRPVSNTADRP
jgi:hypothetical protein